MLSTKNTRLVDTNKVKVKGWGKIYLASNEKNKSGVTIMISDKAKVKIDQIKRRKVITS